MHAIIDGVARVGRSKAEVGPESEREIGIEREMSRERERKRESDGVR